MKKCSFINIQLNLLYPQKITSSTPKSIKNTYLKNKTQPFLRVIHLMITFIEEERFFEMEVNWFE